jgi:hypothetical protein
MRGNSSTNVARRSRRRLVAWLTFAAVGISMGAVWATGFASIGGANGTNGSSPSVTSSNPPQHTPELSGLVTAGSPLTVDWNGRWGGTAATKFFEVDLTGKASGTYNVAMLLTNDISGHGWTSLQLNLELYDAGSGSCTAADFDGTGVKHLVALDTRDAGAYWNGLAAAKRYCIGVAAAPNPASDPTTTFIRRDSDTVAPDLFPTFVATVDRAS